MERVRGINKHIPATWQEALDEFLKMKRAQGIAPRTIEDYINKVGYFFRRYPAAFNPENLRPAVMEFMADKMSPTTHNLRREYLKAFFSWCVREGIFCENPMDDIPKRKDPGEIRHLSEDVLQNLVKLPNRKTFSGLRDYALILLTLSTGIRPGEALALLPEDIDLRRRFITIRPDVSKTRQIADLPIPDVTANAIRDLLKARHPSWPEDTPVFCSYSGRKLTTGAWAERLRLYSKKLGIRLTPYSLRHSFAIELLKSGANAFVLQKMLRHSTMNMTLRYVKLLESDVSEAMKSSNPLDRILPQHRRVRRVVMRLSKRKEKS